MARTALSLCLAAAVAAAPSPAVCGPGTAGCVAAPAGAEEDAALLQMGSVRHAEASLMSSSEQADADKGWQHCGYPAVDGLKFSFEYTRLFRTQGFDPPDYGNVSPLTVPLTFFNELGGVENPKARFVSFFLPSSPSPNARNLTFLCEFETPERLACVEALTGRFFGHLTFDKEDLSKNRCRPTKFDIAAAYGEVLLHPFDNTFFVHALGAITGHGSTEEGGHIPVDVPGGPAGEGEACRRPSKWHPEVLARPCAEGEGLTCVSWCPSGKGVCKKLPRKCDRLALNGNYSLSLTTFTISDTGAQSVEETEVDASFFNQLDGQGLSSDQGVYVQFATANVLSQLGGDTRFALCIQDEPLVVNCVDAASGTPVWRFQAGRGDVDEETCAPRRLQVILYGAIHNATISSFQAFQASVSRGELRKDGADASLISVGAVAASEEEVAGESSGCHFSLESLVGQSYQWTTDYYRSEPGEPATVAGFRADAVSFEPAPEGFVQWRREKTLGWYAACVMESRGTFMCTAAGVTFRYTVEWGSLTAKTCVPRAIREQSWGLSSSSLEEGDVVISRGVLALQPCAPTPAPPSST